MSQKEDLSIAGSGSPISLKKFLLKHPDAKPLTVLVDGTGLGIAKDDSGTIYITREDCAQQALYYCKEVFDGVRVPAYLFRYLNYMMFDDERWNDDKQVAQAFIDGTVNDQSEEYLRVKNFLTYAEHNPEGLQVIGLIQLIGGSLNMARKRNSGIRIYLEHPETALHPKRQSRFISLFYKLQKDYGYEEVQPAHDVDGDQD